MWVFVEIADVGGKGKGTGVFAKLKAKFNVARTFINLIGLVR